MAYYQLITSVIVLAAFVGTATKCASTSSYINIHVASNRNETGEWNISVDLERTLKGRKTGLSVDLKHGTEQCDENETEHFTIETSVDHQQARATEGVTTVGNVLTAPPAPGYKLLVGYGWYKMYAENKSWADARARCVEDGGELLVIDSKREWEEFTKKVHSWMGDFWFWVGVHNTGGNWVTVHGKPVLSMWWKSGWPSGSGRHCAGVYRDGGLMTNWDCTSVYHFACEIPV